MKRLLSALSRHALLSLLLVTLAACDAPQQPRLQLLQPDAVILAYGDSLTFGTGAPSPQQSYPAVLAEISGLDVVNAGVPGEISAEGVQRLDRYLAQVQPDLVILCHGGNDLIRKLDPSHLQRNLDSMIRKIRDAGADVILLSVPRPGIWMQAAPLYQQLAEAHNLVVDNDIIADIESQPELKSDPIHPNAAGYRLLAQRLFELLLAHGALNI